MQNNRKTGTIDEPIHDVKLPSFYGEGFEEHFSKDEITKKIANDDRAKEFHKSLLQTIRENRKDIERLNKFKKATLAYKDRNPALVEINESANKTSEKIFKRSNEFETKVVNYKSALINSVDGELDEHFTRSRQLPAIQTHMLSNLKNKSERLSFARQALSAGDTETLAVILKSKPYLVGLDAEDQQHLRSQLIQSRPEAEVLEQLTEFAAHIGKGWRAAEENLKVLSGEPFERANRLKKDQAAAAAKFEN